MKAALKVLPLVIGCALLLGISNASASSSYVGVTPGTAYDYIFSFANTTAKSSVTYRGNYHVVVQNVTSGNPCGVGLLWSVSSGNISSMPMDVGFTSSSQDMNVSVFNSTTVLFPSFVISTMVSNKSYHMQMQNMLPFFAYVNVLMTWDSRGMLLSLYEDTLTISGQHLVISLNQESSTPGYDTPVMFLAIGISIIGVIGIILKKRH